MRKVLYIFGQLRDQDVEWLAQAGSSRTCGPGTEIIRRGHDAGRLFIVLEGELEVVDARGARLAQVGVGEVVGEMSFVEARAPSATVRALDSVRLFEIPSEQLSNKLEQDPQFASRFYKALALFLSDRLRHASGGRADGSDENRDEIDLNVLDHISQAGARFDRLAATAHRRTFVP